MVLLSNESTFFVAGRVNRNNVRIYGFESPHSAHEHIRDSPKVNV